MDFNKYKPKTDVTCLATVFSGLAGGVGQQIKYTSLSKDYTIPTIKKAYRSLVLSRLTQQVKSVSAPGLPLEARASIKKFKNIFLDIGLMNRAIGIDYNEPFSHQNLLSIYRGQLAEQFVGQEIASASGKPLYYWSRDAKNSNAEIDFIIHNNDGFIPIEVKDGPAGKFKSLHLYRDNYNPSYSIVFYSGMSSALPDESIFFLPLYFTCAFVNNGNKKTGQ
jgi:uncharacterized protein